MSESQGTHIFVSNIKRLMREKHVTQDDVSKALKVHQTTVQPLKRLFSSFFQILLNKKTAPGGAA